MKDRLYSLSYVRLRLVDYFGTQNIAIISSPAYISEYPASLSLNVLKADAKPSQYYSRRKP